MIHASNEDLGAFSILRRRYDDNGYQLKRLELHENDFLGPYYRATLTRIDGIEPTKRVLQLTDQLCEELGWTISATLIRDIQRCSHCGEIAI